MNRKVEQTYIYNGLNNKSYFVSTINRDSSVMDDVEPYTETLVWEYDLDKKRRTKLIDQDEPFFNCRDGHDRMILKYRGIAR